MLADPEFVFGPLRNHAEKPGLQILAVGIRLILGLLLLSQAEISAYPLIIEVLGWISLVAAVVLALIGRNNFKRLMQWALSFSIPYGRAGGVLAAAFGLFLVYAFV